MSTAQSSIGASPKSGLTAFILCMFFGALGLHRFYVGKVGTGILMILTLGGLGFWVLYDLFSIICKNFTDKQDQIVEIAKNSKAPRNVVIVVACLYVGIFGLIFTFVGAPLRALSAVGKAELAALRQGNIAQAYSYTSSAFQKKIDINTFKKFVESYPQLHDNTGSTFTDLEYKDNDGLISGTLSLQDGSTVAIKITLVKENNQWKMFGMTVDKTNAQKSVPASNKTINR